MEVTSKKQPDKTALAKYSKEWLVKNNKHILDCCCGSRMFWFNRQNPNAIFTDIRTEDKTLCDGRKLKVEPDIIADFRDLPFEDNSFKMVVFDPPHLKSLGKNSWLAAKYGRLLPTWEDDIKAGFDEAYRVLDVGGTLIFKWNEDQIKMSKILSVIGKEPLFGHTTNRKGTTKWFTFMKF